MNNEFPTLRLELQAAKQSLITVLDERHHDLQRMIEESFGRAIDVLKQQMDAQVMAALSEVFRDSINQAAKQTAEGLSDELAKAMGDQVREIISKRFKP